MHQKIRLDTMDDIKRFVEVVSRISEPVYIEDGNGCRASAKSLLFTSVARMEWDVIYCCSEKDFSAAIMPWIV